jgi:hypothetical protein
LWETVAWGKLWETVADHVGFKYEQKVEEDWIYFTVTEKK